MLYNLGYWTLHCSHLLIRIQAAGSCAAKFFLDKTSNISQNYKVLLFIPCKKKHSHIEIKHILLPDIITIRLWLLHYVTQLGIPHLWTLCLLGTHKFSLWAIANHFRFLVYSGHYTINLLASLYLVMKYVNSCLFKLITKTIQQVKSGIWQFLISWDPYNWVLS